MANEYDKRVCVYPCYLNSTFSVSKGRKIPKEAACENPLANHIYDCVVQGLKLPAELERKRHPKDWKYLGRVRVQLKDDSGQLLNAEIPSRHALLLKIAELVRRHPGRTMKAKAAVVSGAGAASASGASGSGGGGGGGKKGGKKKR